MFALLIGFIVPAVLFAMFAIFACLKRLYSSKYSGKETYAIIESSENTSRCGIPLFQPTYMRALSDDVGSYQNTYHDHHFVHYLPTLPPSYSEAMNLQVPHHIIEQKIPRRCESCLSCGVTTMNVRRSESLTFKQKHLTPPPSKRAANAFYSQKLSYGVSQKMPVICQY